MDLAMIHDTFRRWTDGLVRQGLTARFAHALETVDGGLVVTAMLLTARPDPEQRAHGPARRRPRECPVARLRYLLAVDWPDHPAQAEQALLLLLAEAGRQPGMELLSDELPPSWWLAQNTRPRPAFQLEACVTEQPELPEAPPVREHRLRMEEPGGG